MTLVGKLVAIQNCAALNDIRATNSGKVTIVDQVLFHDFVSDQVLLDNQFENLRHARVVPSAFRVNNGDRTTPADLKAIRLGPKNTSRLGQPELP